MGNLISYESDEFDYSMDWWETEEPQPVEEEDPLDLSSLPQDLIHTIVKKLHYMDYIQLEETSKSMAATLNNGKFFLNMHAPTVYVNKKTVKLIHQDWYFDSIPRVRWHVATTTAARVDAGDVEINCRATSGRMKAVAKLFEKNQTTAYSIKIKEAVRFEPEDLDRLIMVLKPSYLDCRQFLSREFFTNPELGLNKLSNCYLDSTGCTDDDLLKFKIPNVRMHNDFISDRGLNRFLKQWKKGEREILWYCIEFGSSFGRRNFNTILQGLGANPIWTPDMHEHSLVAGIRMEEFELMEAGDPRHMYSLWKSDKPEETRLLFLSQGRFEIVWGSDEASTLLGLLSEDQFYELRKKCRWCDEEFCYHRGRYTTQRFKKFFPGLNDAIIKGIEIAHGTLFAARCARPLFGSDVSHSPLSTEDEKRIWHEEEAHRSRYNIFMYILRVYYLNV